MKAAAIIGVVFVILGIIIIAGLAFLVVAIFSHDFDWEDIFTLSNMIFLGFVFGIPVVVCLLPGYLLTKSAYN